RLASLQYWLAPLLMALALVTLGDGLRQLLSRIGAPRRMTAVTLTVAAAVSVAAFGVQRDRARFVVAAATQGGITAADVAVIDRLARNVGPGTAVLTDGSSDAGRWLGVLGPEVLYMPKAYLDSHPADQRLTALAGACNDPGAATSALAG